MNDVNTVFIREAKQARDSHRYICSMQNFTSAHGEKLPSISKTTAGSKEFLLT